MPVYEYICAVCERTYEVYHKTTADGEDWLKQNLCVDCKENGKLERLPSTFAPKFVGSGFYSNDYKGKTE